MARALRLLIGGLGLGAAGYGLVQLLDLGTANLRASGSWLIGGVLLHDGVLAPITLLVWFVVTRVLSIRLPAAVVVGAVVLGSLTLVAVPVLGRHHARPDNLTLLDRPYLLGWFVVAGLTLLAVTVAVLRERTSTKGGGRGTRTRG